MKAKKSYYFEEIGSDFEAFMSDYDVNRRLNLIFNYLLKDDLKGKKVLEIGCGTGRISEVLAKGTQELTACDISSVLAKGVGERLSCEYLQSDACSLSIADETYDMVVSSECIEHTGDPLKALSEMKRVLKPGGKMIVTTPDKLWYPLLVVSQKLKIRKFDGPETWIWPHETKRWLKNEGMKIERFSGCHLFPWQIPLAKKLLPFFDNYGSSLYPLMINFGFCAVKKAH